MDQNAGYLFNVITQVGDDSGFDDIVHCKNPDYDRRYYSYPRGLFCIHFQALSIIVSRFEYSGIQSNSLLAFSELANNTGGSPSRRRDI